MAWANTDTIITQTQVEAVYFLILPTEYVILHTTDLTIFGGAILEFHGDFRAFCSRSHPNTPLIPVDAHTAITFGWLTVERMLRNQPYLSDSIKAAVALVS